MSFPDDQVGVLPFIDRSGLVVDAELDRRVERHEAERWLLFHVAPLHGLSGLLIQMSNLFT